MQKSTLLFLFLLYTVHSIMIENKFETVKSVSE